MLIGRATSAVPIREWERGSEVVRVVSRQLSVKLSAYI